jgi:mycothiol synthase
MPFSLRPASLADVDPLTVLLDACTSAHLHRHTQPDETRSRLSVPGCDLPTDSFLAVADDGMLCGFGQVWRASDDEVRGFARVHPDARGGGIGTALRSAMLTRARELAAHAGAFFTTTSWAGDESAPEVLRAGGLTEARYFLRMTTELGPALPEVSAAGGSLLRPYRPGVDDAALLGAFTDAFAEHPGQDQVDPVAWWWDLRDAPDSGYDPGLWTVADVDGELVGFCLARVSEDGEEGYVAQIGVRPPWRGRGIARDLLVSTLHAFAARGLRAAALHVDADNVTSALQLYVGIGMRPRPEFTIWSTPLG